MRGIRQMMVRGCVMLVLSLNAILTSNGQKIAGPLFIEPGISAGYTLFAPLTSKKSYLIDNCGRVINTWQSEFFPGNTVSLMPNGNLLRTIRLPNTTLAGGGGSGGVELFDWDGKLLWTFELNNDSLRLHHDVSFLPNGNVLMLVWEVRKASEVLEAGGNPVRIPPQGLIWSEQIIEVKRNSQNASEVVWKWSAWDHLIQDFDSTKEGFGVVANHPELIDINYVSDVTPDWIHANSIDYNEELDHIIISSPFLNELWVIDHSTTTEQAASHQGGTSGKGGDLLYRWGNPLTYKRGNESDQKLFFQHDVNWVKQGPYKGKIILFNDRKGSNFSSVEIIQPPLNTNKLYEIGVGPFGPDVPELVYMGEPKEELNSQSMAGAQGLLNGNLLICSSRQGFFFEVNPLSGEKVWFYKSPITGAGIIGRDFMTNDPGYSNDIIFRARKYNYDYDAFKFRDLTPQEPIEGEPWAPCDLVTSVDELMLEAISIYPSPVTETLYVKAKQSNSSLSASLLSPFGQNIESKVSEGFVEFSVGQLSNGIYFLNVNGKNYKILKTN